MNIYQVLREMNHIVKILILPHFFSHYTVNIITPPVMKRLLKKLIEYIDIMSISLIKKLRITQVASRPAVLAKNVGKRQDKIRRGVGIRVNDIRAKDELKVIGTNPI